MFKFAFSTNTKKIKFNYIPKKRKMPMLAPCLANRASTNANIMFMIVFLFLQDHTIMTAVAQLIGYSSSFFWHAPTRQQKRMMTAHGAVILHFTIKKKEKKDDNGNAIFIAIVVIIIFFTTKKRQ